jgi:hypothetical protein
VVKAYYKGKCPPKDGEWEKYKTERVPKAQYYEWFGPGTSYSNMSAVTGPISGGLTVLDFDSKEVYECWQKNDPDLAATLPTSKSSRGYHVFIRSNLTKDDLTSFSKIDIKAGGLVTLPPSIHRNGVRYEWIIQLPENVSDLPLLDPYEMTLDYFTDGNDGIDGKEGTDGKEGVGREGCVGFQDLGSKTRQEIEQAIAGTLPKAFRQRYNLLFLFCRLLKKIDEIKERTAEELIEMGVADMWYERALPNIETKSLTMTRSRFANAWEDAKYPPGDGKSLKIAWENAQKSTRPMAELKQFEGEEVMEKLIRLCFELQVLAGPDGVWFIPTRKAPELFDISHSWLGIMLKELCKMKVIEMTKRHTAQKCTRYRFIGPSMAVLQEQTAGRQKRIETRSEGEGTVLSDGH